MELATALIWTLRIVLPIILFCIYFKLQSPKEEAYPGPSNNIVSRGKMLARRKAVAECRVPEELATIALKDQTQAPELFVQSEQRRSMRGSGGGGVRNREERRPPREGREKRDGGPERAKRDKPREMPAEEAEAAAAAVKAAPKEIPANNADKMHLESLLNYVAFNKNVQQRTFLPDDEAAPPPPPPKPPAAKAPASALDSFGGDSSDKAAETTEKANQEAQLVLRGAISYKRSDVTKDIYEQLTERQVEISEKTFTLMIEACVLSRDLKTASNFLMKMETSGFCPDSDLLDKVMELYSQEKTQKEQEKPDVAADYSFAGMGAVAPMPALSGIVGDINQMNNSMEDGARAKLRTDAPLFVPSFGVTTPSPPMAAMDGAAGAPVAATDEIAPQRTKLVAAAKPFEPQFNVTFFPDTYTWSFEEKWEEGAEDDGSKGKGKNSGGKGKSSGKAKGKSGKADEAAASPDKAKNGKPKGDAGKDKKDAGKDGKKSAKAWKPKEAGAS